MHTEYVDVPMFAISNAPYENASPVRYGNFPCVVTFVNGLFVQVKLAPPLTRSGHVADPTKYCAASNHATIPGIDGVKTADVHDVVMSSNATTRSPIIRRHRNHAFIPVTAAIPRVASRPPDAIRAICVECVP